MVEKKILRDIIISLKTGLNPRSNFVLNSPDSNIPYITGKDIFENRVNITEKTDLIDIKALNLINKRACLEDNLLLFASTGTGTVGRMAIINKYDNDWGMSETLYAIKTKDFISPYFLMYSLYSHNIKKQYEPKISKGSVPHLKVVDLLNVQIPIPSIQEQKRIVGILDTFTSSIDNLKQQIAQRRKQYEFYRDQLLDLEGKEGVEMKTLGEVCDIKGDYGLSVPSKPFDGVRYLRITDITDMGGLNDDLVSADLKEESNKEPLVDGDILFARTGATVGKTLVYRNELGRCLFAGYLIRYRLNKSMVSPQFMFHFTHSTRYYNWVQSSLAIGAQPNISAQRYNVLNIPVPSL